MRSSVDIFLYFLFYFLFISTKTHSKTNTETNLNLNFIFIFLTKYIIVFSIVIFLYRNTNQTQNFLHYWNITSNPFKKKKQIQPYILLWSCVYNFIEQWKGIQLER